MQSAADGRPAGGLDGSNVSLLRLLKKAAALACASDGHQRDEMLVSLRVRGLTGAQSSVLVAVGELQPTDQTRMAHAVARPPQMTGRVLVQLESKGLIERRVSAADKRVKLVHLTNQGSSLLAQAQNAATATVPVPCLIEPTLRTALRTIITNADSSLHSARQ